MPLAHGKRWLRFGVHSHQYASVQDVPHRLKAVDRIDKVQAGRVQIETKGRFLPGCSSCPLLLFLLRNTHEWYERVQYTCIYTAVRWYVERNKKAFFTPRGTLEQNLSR